MRTEINKNQNNKVRKLLEMSGFSDKETAVYLALLELGKGTVTEISRKSGVSRTHCYLFSSELISKNLISVSGKEPKQEYVSESPMKLKEFLEKKFLTQKKVFEETEQIIPELVSMHKTGNRPRVRFYEGLEGIKEVYEDTLTSHEELKGFLTYEELHKALANYFPDYYQRRAKKGILGRGIVTDTPEGRERAKFNEREVREIRFVPEEYYFYPEINIYDNKVMIASWREKLGIIIESDEIADALKKIWKLAWIGAGEVEKEKFSN